MNKVRVCSLMWGTAWDRYGSIFAETFSKYWDEDIELALVVDKEVPFDRANQVLLSDLPRFSRFKTNWNGKEISSNWKYDVPKWAPQGITPISVLELNPHWEDSDIYVWLDADIETTDFVDSNWIEEVLGDYDIACLQRKPVHTEIGFYAMRLSVSTRNVLEQFSEYYSDLSVLEHKEYHSAYMWDRAVEKFPEVTINNLNKTNNRTHVFPLTILNEKLVHNKGHRKPGGG